MRAALAVLGALGCAIGLCTSGARAHVVYDRESLRQYLQYSAASALVELESGPLVWEAADGSDRQEYFRARLVTPLSGDPHGPVIEFFAHAEGLPRFTAGDRALLFLERTSDRLEFLRLAARFPFYSVQGAGSEWRVAKGEEGAVLALARGYRELAGLPEPSAVPRLRQLLLSGLRSPVPALRDDAVVELTRAANAPGFLAAPEDVRPFGALVDGKKLPFGTRLALAVLLDGKPGFDTDRALLAMTREPLAWGDRRNLVRVAAKRPAPPLGRWIGSLLAAAEPELRAEAASALRESWHAGEVPALARAADEPEPRVSRAALQSLGAIASPEARAALRRVAGGADAARARLAKAELRRLGEPPVSGAPFPP